MHHYDHGWLGRTLLMMWTSPRPKCIVADRNVFKLSICVEQEWRHQEGGVDCLKLSHANPNKASLVCIYLKFSAINIRPISDIYSACWLNPCLLGNAACKPFLRIFGTRSFRKAQPQLASLSWPSLSLPPPPGESVRQLQRHECGRYQDAARGPTRGRTSYGGERRPVGHRLHRQRPARREQRQKCGVPADGGRPRQKDPAAGAQVVGAGARADGVAAAASSGMPLWGDREDERSDRPRRGGGDRGVGAVWLDPPTWVKHIRGRGCTPPCGHFPGGVPQSSNYASRMTLKYIHINRWCAVNPESESTQMNIILRKTDLVRRE